jgi:hypothetical protein
VRSKLTFSSIKSIPAIAVFTKPDWLLKMIGHKKSPGFYIRGISIHTQYSQGIIQHFFFTGQSDFSLILHSLFLDLPIFFSMPLMLAIATAVNPATITVANINFFILFVLGLKITTIYRIIQRILMNGNFLRENPDQAFTRFFNPGFLFRRSRPPSKTDLRLVR